MFQAAGKDFVPNFKAINAAGRSEKAVKHIWEALKKSYASANDVNGKLAHLWSLNHNEITNNCLS